MSPAAGLIALLPQWLGALAGLWLIWWAAQSRDAVAFRVVAIALVVVPALLLPILSLLIPQLMRGSYANIGLIFGLVSAGVGVSRALFLAIWAGVSKDTALLRAVGGALAALLLLYYLLAWLAMAWLSNLGS